MQLLTTSPMPIQRQDLDQISALRRNIESVIFGKTEVVKLAVTCLLARGHAANELLAELLGFLVLGVRFDEDAACYPFALDGLVFRYFMALVRW